MKRSGRLWVLGLLLLGSAGGAFAVWHWSRPESAVRWTFSQFHTALLRKRMDAPRQIAADTVTLDGLPMPKEDFLAAYEVPSKPGDLQVAPCPAAPGHWAVTRGSERAWCFLKEGRAWKLHRVGPTPCDEN